jgi:magnesium-transporting ATPase (P-type)
MSEEVRSAGSMQVTTRMKSVAAAFTLLGGLAFAFLLAGGNPERAWHAYLIGLFYFCSLALGGLFFAAINHAGKAGWVVNVRRIGESLTAFLPAAFGFCVILLFGAHHLYDWLDAEKVAADYYLQHKAPYLNEGFFWVRVVLFFGGWLLFSKLIVGNSLKQDASGDQSFTHKNVKWSVIFLLFFALSYSLFSVDTLMSLEPLWFSTIFGVYAFAGLFQSTMATMIIISIYLMKKGPLKGFVDENHLHDLGKFLFAFTVFWAHIAFSQYMLIWYANLPEETFFFKDRSQAPWVYISIALILFKFIVPFFALLPRWAKRTPAHLIAVSVLILVMQYVDLYWLVYPALDKHHLVFGVAEIFVFLGFAGVFMFVVSRFLGRHPVVPHKDPRIHESNHHHVVY